MIKICTKNNIMESLLIEAMALHDIHSKYYPNIAEDEFMDIIKADPTYRADTPKKMGQYGKWLLGLYGRGSLKKEDLYKATEYLTSFHKAKKMKVIKEPDINHYKTLTELYDAVESYLHHSNRNNELLSNREKEITISSGAEKCYEDSEWVIIIPHTREAAIKYGKGTQWCTAATNSYNAFEDYDKEGNLYILINKKNQSKYQFHFESDSFMDEKDSPIDTKKFLGDEANKKVRDYFLDIRPDDVLKIMYDKVSSPYGSKILTVRKDRKYNILDDEYQIKYPDLWFDYISLFSSAGNIVVKITGKGGNYINAEGNLLFPNIWFDNVTDFYKGRAGVSIKGRINFIDPEGHFLLDQWIEGGDISRILDDGFALIERRNGDYYEFNIINDNYNIISKEWFDRVEGFSNGIAKVEKNGKYNFINQRGELLYTGEWFDNVDSFSNGIAMVKKNRKYNFINQEGELLFKEWIDVDYAENFYDGFALVEKNGKYNFINQEGEFLFEIWFDSISRAYLPDHLRRDGIIAEIGLGYYPNDKKLYMNGDGILFTLTSNFHLKPISKKKIKQNNETLRRIREIIQETVKDYLNSYQI